MRQAVRDAQQEKAEQLARMQELGLTLPSGMEDPSSATASPTSTETADTTAASSSSSSSCACPPAPPLCERASPQSPSSSPPPPSINPFLVRAMCRLGSSELEAHAALLKHDGDFSQALRWLRERRPSSQGPPLPPPVPDAQSQSPANVPPLLERVFLDEALDSLLRMPHILRALHAVAHTGQPSSDPTVQCILQRLAALQDDETEGVDCAPGSPPPVPAAAASPTSGDLPAGGSSSVGVLPSWFRE